MKLVIIKKETVEILLILGSGGLNLTQVHKDMRTMVNWQNDLMTKYKGDMDIGEVNVYLSPKE